MKTLVAMTRAALFAGAVILVAYILLLVIGNVAFADEAVRLGEQNRAVLTYEGREVSESAEKWHVEQALRDFQYQYRYKGVGDERGVKFCTHTDISVAAVLWELTKHPELIPVVERALQEYYDYHHERNGHEQDHHKTDASSHSTLPPT